MFKFKVDPAETARIEEKIKAAINKAADDPEVLNGVGKFLTERIRYQARIAQPFNDPIRGMFYPLAPQTIVSREYIAKYNSTNAAYAPARSNITLSGAFLNSLGFEITGSREVTLSFKGMHPGYKGSKGQQLRKKPLSNAQLAEYLTDLGFTPFTVQAVDQQKPVKARIRALVRAALRKTLRLS